MRLILLSDRARAIIVLFFSCAFIIIDDNLLFMCTQHTVDSGGDLKRDCQ